MSTFIEPRLDRVPAELTSKKQWVVWKAVPKKNKPGQFTKVPYSPTTKRKASSTNPIDWSTFEDAVEAFSFSTDFTGIGFVFSAGDDLIGIDLDHCFDDKGELTPTAASAVRLMDSYTEKSPSGNGLHIICRGRLPGEGHCDNKNGREMYQQGRFFTITAETVDGRTDVHERKHEVREIYEEWFGANSVKNVVAGDLEWDKAAPIIDLDKVPLTDYTRNLIRNGENMDDFTSVTGEPDRSLAVFYACREMVGSGVNKETILTILTDDAFYLAQASLERRDGNTESAREWVWKYSLAKVMAQHADEKALFDDLMDDAEVIDDGFDDVPAQDTELATIDKELGVEKATPSYVKGNFEKNALTFLSSGVPLVRYQEQFFKYNEKHWQLYSDELVERDVQVQVRGKGFTMAQINNTIKTVKRFSTKESFQPSPTIISFRNGVIDLDGWDMTMIDNTLRPHSHKHKTMSYLDFDYDPSARCRVWLKFLGEVFENDPDRIQLLQQYMGYLLVYDYRWQKMLIMAGESRSGKGTIAAVIRAIVGADAYVGTSLSNMSTDFGLHSLITAKVAVIGDAKQAARGNINRAHEVLLNITGNDFITVARKHKGDLNFRVPARIVMMANSVPRFADEADALFNRYLVLPFKVSFAGREDVTLSHKLEDESAGIFNWALEGLFNLATRGAFVETESGRQKADEMRVYNNPVGTFVETFLVRGGENDSIRKKDLYNLYTEFCKEIDIKHTTNIDFSRKLGSLAPWIDTVRETGGERAWCYTNVTLDFDKLSEYVTNDLE